MGRKETDHSVAGFSMPEDDFQQFEAFWKGKYPSRQAAIIEGIKLLKTDAMKAILPEHTADIEQFQLYIGKIVDAYRSSLDGIATANDRAERKVAGQLEGMASLARANQKLEAEKAEWAEKKAELESVITEQSRQIIELEAKLTSLSHDSNEISDLKKRCACLTQEKADLIAAHNAEIAKLQNDNFSRILEIVKASSK